jgi:hypothetical protein
MGQRMRFYDIFNGDADGICALHQLRLAEPCDALLVTGVKRDIRLLDRIAPQPGDRITVLDLSLDTNRGGLMRALEAGASCRYFDHHFSGKVPDHPRLDAHIDTAPDICTSLIVDRYLQGRYRAWAVVAAFGDNLLHSALAAAAKLGLGEREHETLRELGECINYNAYGESIEELFYPPDELYRRLHGYADPLEFARNAPEFRVLRLARAEDMERARALPVERTGSGCIAVFMPDEAWSRRVSGVFANALSQQHMGQAVALLVRSRNGYRVSLRAPGHSGSAKDTGVAGIDTAGIDTVARAFESGNGRSTAAGIQFLPESGVDRLFALLDATYGAARPPQP